MPLCTAATVLHCEALEAPRLDVEEVASGAILQKIVTDCGIRSDVSSRFATYKTHDARQMAKPLLITGSRFETAHWILRGDLVLRRHAAPQARELYVRQACGGEALSDNRRNTTE